MTEPARQAQTQPAGELYREGPSVRSAAHDGTTNGMIASELESSPGPSATIRTERRLPRSSCIVRWRRLPEYYSVDTEGVTSLQALQSYVGGVAPLLREAQRRVLARSYGRGLEPSPAGSSLSSSSTTSTSGAGAASSSTRASSAVAATWADAAAGSADPGVPRTGGTPPWI